MMSSQQYKKPRLDPIHDGCTWGNINEVTVQHLDFDLSVDFSKKIIFGNVQVYKNNLFNKRSGSFLNKNDEKNFLVASEKSCGSTFKGHFRY